MPNKGKLFRSAEDILKLAPNKHTTSPQRRYNVAATSRRCSGVVTTLLWRVFTGYWVLSDTSAILFPEFLIKETLWTRTADSNDYLFYEELKSSNSKTINRPYIVFIWIYMR